MCLVRFFFLCSEQTSINTDPHHSSATLLAASKLPHSHADALDEPGVGEARERKAGNYLSKTFPSAGESIRGGGRGQSGRVRVLGKFGFREI